MEILTTILTTAVVLGVLIFVHELGHFLVAKWMGVSVLRFSLGFGPRVYGIKRGETDYCLSAIPLGGYVKMLGEEPDEEVTEEQMARSFGVQPVFRRIAIVLAGPFSNFALAILLFTGIYAFSGIPHVTAEIGSINPASPAESAGLQPGDRVLSINGELITTWDELSKAIERNGVKPAELEVRRGEGQVLKFRVEPAVTEVKNLFGEAVKRPIMGVTAAGHVEIREVNPLMAGYYSLNQTWSLTKLFFMTVVKLFQRIIPFNTLGGPILIAQMAGQQAREGAVALLNFMALISVNLAVLNLLPIPVLDGGHIMFFSIEALMRKPLGIKKIEWAQKAGMAFLLLLMAFVFYNDVLRLIPGSGVPGVNP